MPWRQHLVSHIALVALLSCRLPLMAQQPDPELPPPPYPSTGVEFSDPVALGAYIEPIEAPPPESEVAAEEAVLKEELEPEAEPQPQWYNVAYWFGPTPWDTAVELGLNGSSGTSDTLSMRVGGYVKRKTERHKLDISLYHNQTQSNGIETQNNALLDARHDWLFAKSPWSIYILSQVFHDEFQTYDLNVNVNSGIGYQFIDEDFFKLACRIGNGASREFGGKKDAWVPEAQAGLDFQQKISDTQKFYGKIDYFPEWEDFGRYRMLTDLGFEVQLSVPSRVSLKLSANDRYDSEPDGAKPHNTNYSALMIWRL
ncbi:hypothetical protein Pla175_51390 [Pirellulimonas nuda]|uniref:DUF481 domain-containing protein n=1 Tax=Pirellulimonas nuda TaxID=2528009 RepID=A0A518DJQ1_9BACT|nr:DUF481 domain-containing protein [Pirellulimonas nuda]QDU91709.1 hypothetical protein Pla175_51390 [Pirellulimonas nuda]